MKNEEVMSLFGSKRNVKNTWELLKVIIFKILKNYNTTQNVQSRAKNSGRQCHFKIWLDCHKLKNFPA
jgi:hypothetical protein